MARFGAVVRPERQLEEGLGPADVARATATESTRGWLDLVRWRRWP